MLFAAELTPTLLALASTFAAATGGVLGILAFLNQRRERKTLEMDKGNLAQREDVEALLHWKDDELARLQEERGAFITERGVMMLERQQLYAENGQLHRDVYTLGNRVSELESLIAPLRDQLAHEQAEKAMYLAQLRETQTALAECRAGKQA